MKNPIASLLRACGQMDDPVFVGVVLRSLVFTAISFAGLLAVMLWGAHRTLAWAPEAPRWLGWIIDFFGTIGAALLAFWLFLPVAVGIGTLFIDRVAAAVEHRFYPGLSLPRGAPLAAQLWDAGALGLRVLLLSVVALVLALLLPGIGAILAWAISGWAIGRGLFVSVAMRRMGLREAESLHRENRFSILAVGGVLALAGFLPPLNLLMPVIGIAAMVHILHAADDRPGEEFPRRGLFPR